MLQHEHPQLEVVDYAQDITLRYSFMLSKQPIKLPIILFNYSFQIAYYSHIIPPKHNIVPMSSTQVT